MWLDVDKETLSALVTTEAKESEDQTWKKSPEPDSHAPAPPGIPTYISLVVKAPECIHGSEICYLDSLSEFISLSHFCDAAAVLPDSKETSFQVGQPISMCVTCSVAHRYWAMAENRIAIQTMVSGVRSEMRTSN